MNTENRQRVRTTLAGQGGFTLIELMVVMVILGILAGLIVPRIMDRPEEVFYYLCPVCGNIEKTIPEACPICGAPKSRFAEVA